MVFIQRCISVVGSMYWIVQEWSLGTGGLHTEVDQCSWEYVLDSSRVVTWDRWSSYRGVSV